MRVKAQAIITVSTDTDQYDVLFQRTKDTLNQIIRDDLNAQSSGVVRLAAAGVPPLGTPFTLPMGDVATGKILFVYADQEITIKISGGTTEHIIKPSGAYKGALFWHGQFTAAPIVENQANAVATVEYCIVGLEA